MVVAKSEVVATPKRFASLKFEDGLAWSAVARCHTYGWVMSLFE